MECAQAGLGFGENRSIALLLREGDQADGVLDLLRERVASGDGGIEPRALAHHAPGARGIAPELGLLRLPVQPGEFGAGGIQVKDASSAVRATA